MEGDRLVGRAGRDFRKLVEVGRYASGDDVIGETLCLFQEREDQSRLADFRREIAMGLDDGNPVEPDPSNPDPSWKTCAELDTRVKRERQAASDEELD